MTHFKNICLVVLIMIVFIRCSEIYTPNINSATQALVVQGLITDGSGPFTVKLTKSSLYTSDTVPDFNTVSGAKLTVKDNENQTFAFADAGKGNYTLSPTFKAKIGNSYKLHIETPDGNIYESSIEKLLAPQTIDSIRGFYTSQSYLGVDKQLKTVEGADIRVDLFKSVSNLDSRPSCRFSPNITIQYMYNYSEPDTISWQWFVFGWSSRLMNGNENITDEKSSTNGAFIKNHSVGFMPFPVSSYGFMLPQTASLVYFLRINQYTMNNDSYIYYKGANSQLAASGKLFDPIATQLYGNMTCINDPTKIVLGLFEVSSVTQTAYVINNNATYKYVVVNKVPSVDIPPKSEYQYKIWNLPSEPPKSDSIEYIHIPLPSWWFHN